MHLGAGETWVRELARGESTRLHGCRKVSALCLEGVGAPEVKPRELTPSPRKLARRWAERVGRDVRGRGPGERSHLR